MYLYWDKSVTSVRSEQLYLLELSSVAKKLNKFYLNRRCLTLIDLLSLLAWKHKWVHDKVNDKQKLE